MVNTAKDPKLASQTPGIGAPSHNNHEIESILGNNSKKPTPTVLSSTIAASHLNIGTRVSSATGFSPLDASACVDNTTESSSAGEPFTGSAGFSSNTINNHQVSSEASAIADYQYFNTTDIMPFPFFTGFSSTSTGPSILPEASSTSRELVRDRDPTTIEAAEVRHNHYMAESKKFHDRLILIINWHEADLRLYARMQSERQFYIPVEIARVNDQLKTWMAMIKYLIPGHEFYDDEAARMKKLIKQLQSARGLVPPRPATPRRAQPQAKEDMAYVRRPMKLRVVNPDKPTEDPGYFAPRG